MHTYSVRDVERVLRLSRSTVRALINAGFVAPSRGVRREYRFSFRDLIVLRAARALMDAKVPRRRISRSLEDLRRRLPDAAPLSGLSICAVGDRVVVRDGANHWQVDDGQYLLGLDVSMENGVLRVIERKASEAPQPHSADWFARALELEAADTRAALHAYEHATREDPQAIGAWINWGRLLHETGELRKAESVYRRAIEQCGANALLMFNLGVLLEDAERTQEALQAYHACIEEDPGMADCHYNLARLYESLGEPQHAIRHLGQYRRLVSA
ncbi:MAG TPA: tetratricopeptide repeat protein [Steroidobacter sp.]|jgi:tetratricopeptide (TPR) repeat protein|nr:tetratricopeptide repeat protein [Steroidobacteraceae bacterium]HLS82783.1 tetratricopeptide repeat protein [Steroidobacter sp.]